MPVVKPAPVLMAWVVAIGIDFLVFGGLAGGLLEQEGGSAVLGADDLFRRIPAGYVSFLVLVLLVAWVVDRRPVDRPAAGAAVGAVVGVGIGGAMLAGIWSFSTVPLGVLAIWAVTITLQLSAAGWVLVYVVGGGRRAAWRSAGAAVALVVLGAVVQNLD